MSHKSRNPPRTTAKQPKSSSKVDQKVGPEDGFSWAREKENLLPDLLFDRFREFPPENYCWATLVLALLVDTSSCGSLRRHKSRERKISPSFLDQSFSNPPRTVDLRTLGSWMSAPESLSPQGFDEGPDRSFDPGRPREGSPDVRSVIWPLC